VVFRLFEYAAGVYSPMTTALSKSEVYPYVFDSTLMFFALLVFNIIHPGRILVGPLDEYPTGRQRRAERKVRGEKKKFDKAVKKAIKKTGLAPQLGMEGELDQERDDNRLIDDERRSGFYRLNDVESRGSLPTASTAKLV
jgi:hypothetical protein